MNAWRRWSVSLRGRLDEVVSQIENQGAVVDEAIRDVHRAAARARVQLRRVQRDGSALRQKIEQERKSATEWRERATRLATEDEKRAVECLRRAKRAERTLAELEGRRLEHERAEKALASDVRAIELRLGSLRERRNVMRTRQSRAEASSALRDPNDTIVSLDDVFDRWETRVTEMELVGGDDFADSRDAFEDDFVSEEEEDALREELRGLGGGK